MPRKTPDTQGLLVGMDGYEAVENYTGVGNYSRYAVNIMSMAFPGSQFRLYAPRQKENERFDPLIDRENVELAVPKLKPDCTLVRGYWRSVDMPVMLKRDGVEIYHGLVNVLPLTIRGACPSVVTIHDLIWHRFPQDFSPAGRRFYDFCSRQAAKNASRVIAISECTKRDLMNDWDVPEDKIDVIYQGVDPIFSLPVDTAARMAVREKYKLPERYVISVGTVLEHKNQMLTVRALAGMPARIHLVLIGSLASDYGKRVKAEIERLGLSDRIHHLSGVPFTDFPALYACAEATMFTSAYEGFGLPVVESLTVGTPVVACTGSCIEEAGGGGAIYVEPDDVEGCARAATHLVESVVFHDKTAGLGRRYVRKFSADSFAIATMATYKKAIISELG